MRTWSSIDSAGSPTSVPSGARQTTVTRRPSRCRVTAIFLTLASWVTSEARSRTTWAGGWFTGVTVTQARRGSGNEVIRTKWAILGSNQ